MTSSAPTSVAHLGPEISGEGGMPAVLRTLLAPRPTTGYRLVFIRTYPRLGEGRRLRTFVRGLVALARWSRLPGSALVHVHATVRGSMHRKAVCVVVAKALGLPVVLHVHAGAAELETFHAAVGPVRRRGLRELMRFADRVLAVSQASADELRDRYGARAVEVLPNPVSVAFVANGAEPEPDAEEVLYLGGFRNPVKGGELLLAALPALRRIRPEASVTLAGPGELPASARRAVADDARVRWRGWLDDADKAQALARARVVVLPSTSEGLPIALLEAMAHGKGIVATRVGGIPDVITDGREGLLVAPGDADALATAVAALMADPERSRRLGRCALARSRSHAPDVVMDRLDTIYRELLDGRC